jgi:hypothetical protein
MATQNSINLKSSGIVTYDAAGTFTASTVTNHGVVTAQANNLVTSVAPGTSGNVLTSNGTDWTSAASTSGAKYSTGFGMSTTFSPLDATTYFVGFAQTTLATTCGQIPIPVAGTINTCYVVIRCTAGTAETSTISLRLNNTTDFTISSAVNLSAAQTSWGTTSLGITVAAGDFVQVKWVTPTWATNPLTTQISCGFIVS